MGLDLRIRGINKCPRHGGSTVSDVTNFRNALQYWGERVSLEMAHERCGAGNFCSRNVRPSCDRADLNIGSYCLDNNHYWTNDSCKIRAKINAEGKVAIVPAPRPSDTVPNHSVNRFVQEDTATFFRVD